MRPTPLGVVLSVVCIQVFFLGCNRMISQKSHATADSEIMFQKQVVYPEFISEGVAVADVNRDGMKDIIAGYYWFEAPSCPFYTTRCHMREPRRI